MKVTTLRLPEDLVKALDDEYDEYGHSNRSEYVRWLLERREGIRENTENTTACSERDTENTLGDRVDDLETHVDASLTGAAEVLTSLSERIDELEHRLDERAEGDRVDDLEARLAAVEDRLHTTIDGDVSLVARDGADDETSGHHRETPPGDERGQETPETATASEPTATDETIERIVEDVSASWDDDDRLEDRRDAARAALRLMRDRGSLGRTVASEQLLPEYAVEGQNERTWWRQNIRDAVAEAGSYSRGRSEYVWNLADDS